MGVDIATASDHTFTVAKNYRDLPSDACCFTENTSLGAFCGGLFIKPTAIVEAAHAIRQFLKQPNVCPKISVIHNCPANLDIFQVVFSHKLHPVMMRLGMFHFIPRK